MYEPTNGKIDFYGETIVENHPQGKMKKLYAGENMGMYTDIVSHTPDVITEKGIARTFQNIRLFSKLSVFENVLIAKHMRAKQNFFLSRAPSQRCGGAPHARGDHGTAGRAGAG